MTGRQKASPILWVIELECPGEWIFVEAFPRRWKARRTQKQLERLNRELDPDYRITPYVPRKQAR